jgi:pimeloyl-ACP methyl ester carboxylesterase
MLLTADGSSIACRHTPGITPGVLFLPGFRSNMQGIKALALEDYCLCQGRQFTRFDYTGHGESSGRFEDGSIGSWRDDALHVLDRISSGPQLLVGSSMGGWIMLLLALARPERVSGLLGIAAAPDFTETRRERLDAVQRQQLETLGYCEQPNSYDDARPYRIGRRLLDESREHCLLGQPIAIDAPIRLIHAMDDPDVPWQRSLELADRVSSADVELHILKRGGHRLSEPADLQRLLRVLDAMLAA